MIEVRLLGPMQVLIGGVSLPLGTPKQQTVLAMLAIRPGQIITLEELIDELWPDAAPASAVANTRGYAARLRRVFDQMAATRGLLARCGPGYQFRVRPDDVDLLAFETECQQASEAISTGDLSGVGDLIRQAENRWRGPMLPGMPLGPMLSARRTAVLAQRLNLVEQRAELLAIGLRHAFDRWSPAGPPRWTRRLRVPPISLTRPLRCRPVGFPGQSSISPDGPRQYAGWWRLWSGRTLAHR
ncbi:BTAD domain-containing putative transcriptional regulator [Plantactinospora sp. ZYX-F-223]|uniref:AfsR/SARP family transcriptional regulator n=1 Tax=Plantactinospora sp. ZYX-F-223 TaxID=3144103 RepID=UPI0031FBB94A